MKSTTGPTASGDGHAPTGMPPIPPEAYKTSPGAREMGSLIRTLFRKSEALLRGEAILARAELSERLTRVERGVAGVASGGAVLFAGILILLLAAVFALGMFIPLWLAALLIGACTILLGGILVGSGKRKASPANLIPRDAIAEAKKDAALVKERVQ